MQNIITNIAHQGIDYLLRGTKRKRTESGQQLIPSQRASSSYRKPMENLGMRWNSNPKYYLTSKNEALKNRPGHQNNFREIFFLSLTLPGDLGGVQ